MSIWGGVEDVVSKVAPILGSAVGVANPLAGIAISLISKVFSANKDDPADILAKIKADPDAILKLKKIELDHQEVLAQIASQDLKTEVQDRQGARDMNIQLHSYVPTIIAIGYCFTYVAIMGYCVLNPQSVNDVITARLHDGLMMILAYFFGRNHEHVIASSQNKVNAS